MAGRLQGMIEAVSAIAEAAAELEAAVLATCPPVYLADLEHVGASRQGDPVYLGWNELAAMTARATVAAEKLEGALMNKQAQQEERRRLRGGLTLRPVLSVVAEAGGEARGAEDMEHGGEAGDEEGD